MNELLDTIYDVIAQNTIKGVRQMTHDELTGLVDHVDYDRNEIVFINNKGKEFVLKLEDR